MMPGHETTAATGAPEGHAGLADGRLVLPLDHGMVAPFLRKGRRYKVHAPRLWERPKMSTLRVDGDGTWYVRHGKDASERTALAACVVEMAGGEVRDLLFRV